MSHGCKHEEAVRQGWSAGGEGAGKRHFEAYYVSTAAEAVEKVVELIPKEHTVSWGGTATVDALGIKQRLAQEGIALIDRDTAQTPQERQEMLKKALTCGTFLMSKQRHLRRRSVGEH